MTIQICCDEQSLFGGNTAGYDIAGSQRRYRDLVTAAVQAAYPDADVDTTVDPQMWGVRVWVGPTRDSDDEGDIEIDVLEIAGEILYREDWAIMIPS